MSPHAVGPAGLTAAILVLALMIVFVRSSLRPPAAADAREAAAARGGTHKKVVIRAEDGTEHAASLSLEEVESGEEALEALADLISEVRDRCGVGGRSASAELPSAGSLRSATAR